jgi:pilus assembly protein CpaB
MKTRAIIPLIVGLAIGVFAIRSFLNVLKKARASDHTETVQVVRASTDIGATDQITEEMLETTEVPKSLVPPGAWADPSQIVGRVTCSVIPAGVPVVPALLAPEGTRPGMASLIPPGYRAMAIEIDEIAGVGGWLTPGSRVDVVAVLSGTGSTKGTVSKVILQNIEVSAVGQKIVSEGPGAAVTRSVTIIVTPEQGNLVALAASKGRLRLSMRNQSDGGTPESEVVTIQDLLQDRARSTATTRPSTASMLAQLLRNPGKNDSPQTDKEEAPEPVRVAAVQPVEDWHTVQVLAGANHYEVRFDSDEANARPVRSVRGRAPSAPPQSRATVAPSSPAGGQPTTEKDTGTEMDSPIVDEGSDGEEEGITE